MGTSTIFVRHNDIGRRLAGLEKEELEKVDMASPWKSEEQDLPGGWSCPLELHNSNIGILVWWQGRLLELRDAPERLQGRHYNRYKGKIERWSDWAVAKRMLGWQLAMAEKKFRSLRRKARKSKKLIRNAKRD